MLEIILKIDGRTYTLEVGEEQEDYTWKFVLREFFGLLAAAGFVIDYETIDDICN